MGADLSLNGGGIPSAADLHNMGCCGTSRQSDLDKEARRGMPGQPKQMRQRHYPDAPYQYPDQRQNSVPTTQVPVRAFAAEVSEPPPTPPRPQDNDVDRGEPREGLIQTLLDSVLLKPAAELKTPEAELKKTELKKSKSMPTKEAAPQQKKVKQWLTKYESERNVTQEHIESNNTAASPPANRDTRFQVSEAKTKLRSASHRAMDDPDLVSRPSRTPVGQGRTDAPSSMGQVGSAAFNMGQVPQAKFSMERTESASRRAPPSDGAWFADPEGKVSTPEPPVVLPAADKSPKNPRRDRERERVQSSGYDDPDIISRPAKAPMGRSSSKNKLKEGAQTGSRKELKDPTQTSIGEPGYNTIKVAVEHLRNTRERKEGGQGGLASQAINPYGPAVNSMGGSGKALTGEGGKGGVNRVGSFGSNKQGSRTRLF